MDFYKNFPTSSINLDESFESLLESLSVAEITCMDLLSTPPIELANKHNLNLNKLLHLIHYLKKEQIKEFEPNTRTLTDLNEFCIPTGDLAFDDALNGGIYSRQITEVFGESATGKSQFVMQLTRSVSETFPGGKSVVISTEGFVETKRLVEINPGMQDVLTINCMDLEIQEHILNVQLPSLLVNQGDDIKLVVIDSISHHLRVEFENDFEKLKHKLLEFGMKLLDLCIEYNFALVVTNQISDKPVKKILDTDYKKLTLDYQLGWLHGWKSEDILKRQNYDEMDGDYLGNAKISTMGLNWDQFIDVKIVLLKFVKLNENNKENQELNNIDNNFWLIKRFFKLVYSNRSTNNLKIEYKINKQGISSITSDL